MDDLLQEFVAETRETLEALSGEIVAWESAPDDRQRLDAIFRFVHTVKGSCGFLDLPRLARLSHAAEDVLAAVRDGERAPDTALVNAVLAIVDRIGELVEAIDAGAALDDSGEELLISALDQTRVVAADTAEPGLPSLSPVSRAPTRSVRLHVDLLDRMMSGMSDMVLARNELARHLRGDALEPSVEAALDRLSLTVAEMRDTVTRTRMQKVEALFSALPRMVRDTAAELGKSVTLTVEGGEVELDREMIEMMRDPLVHIIRNSIDHGIEDADTRRIARKRAEGRLTVSARQSGNQIIIEIVDDGRGIDTERLIAKLVEGGRPEHELRALSPKAKLNLVFEAGLTTKDLVTNVSGRGVGMDVVRANIEQIGGRIDLSSSLGTGLSLAIHVPLTLSIIPTIGVGIGDQRFAVPRQAIEEIVSIANRAVRVDMLGGTATATVRDRRMPLIDLGKALGLPRDEGAASMLMIVGIVGGSYALAVDSVLDHEELVIKPAVPAVMATGVYAGQTLPDTGLPMLLIDCTGIALRAGLQFERQAIEEEAAEPEAQGVAALLFDDLDGQRRLVPLVTVDRIQPVPVDSIRTTGGQLRLAIDGVIVPLVTEGDWIGRTEITVLRLRDGAMEIGYAIAEALDIVTLPPALAPARFPGPVAGVVMLEGEQVELLDVHWLFAEHGDGIGDPSSPVCLIDGAGSAWMMTFLRPALEAAGYRVITEAGAADRPAVVLTMDGEAATPSAAAPVVRLRQERQTTEGDDSVYRFDRDGVLAALAASVGRGR